MFFDDDGVLNVYLAGEDVHGFTAMQAQEKEARIRAGISAAFGRALLGNGDAGSQTPDGARGRPIKLIKGKYTIKDLATWRAKAKGLFDDASVVLLDLDERRNRVTIGVVPSTSRERIQSRLTRLEIPADAVIVEETERAELLDRTLRSEVRPVPAGYQIAGEMYEFFFRTCTLSFNAVRTARPEELPEGARSSLRYGFVTCSHCTGSRGGGSTTFHQPEDYWDPRHGSKIGTEVLDPPSFTGDPCPAGKRCRVSDSAFVDYSVASGRNIARTAAPNGGSLVVDAAQPTFPIVGEIASFTPGMVLNKVGRTTGWTQGRVTETCIDLEVTGSDVHLLCQTSVDRPTGYAGKMSDSGDSGSPVFFVDPATGDALLAGVLWGSWRSRSAFLFSSIAQVKQDLGELTTYDFPKPLPRPPPIRCPDGRYCCETALDEAGKPRCVRCVPIGQECPELVE